MLIWYADIVSNTMLSNREALDNITAKQVAQRMKSLYHRDFSHRFVTNAYVYVIDECIYSWSLFK